MPIIGNFGGGSSKVDKTLLMEGVAADAKATGEAIEAVKTMYVTAEFGEEIFDYGAISQHTLVNVSSTPEEIINAYKGGVRVVLEHPDEGCFDVAMVEEDKSVVLFFGVRVSVVLQIVLEYSGDAVICEVTKMYLQEPISGTEGQIVGFNSSGKATAQDFPQSDWSENDETAAGYVKNRPFYTEDPVETVFVEETTISEWDEYNGHLDTANTTGFVPELGQEYRVTWNGVEYTCVAYDGSWDLVAIGNDALADGTNDTGEPFYIDKDWIEAVTNDTSSHTFSIEGDYAAIVKIEKKYIPDEAFVGAPGTGSCSEVFNNLSGNAASGDYSHAEGYSTTASGLDSHAEGDATTASGNYSHAEGVNSKAIGDCSHAEGYDTTASGTISHAEGVETVAYGYFSHAEGKQTTASGEGAHAEGYSTTASGDNSHAEGYYTKASSEHQHVQGKFNIPDTNNTYAHIVGGGYGTGYESNIHTIDWNGNAWFAGDVYVGSTKGIGTTGTNKDEGSVKLQKEITGTPGQVVGFDESGNAVAQEAPSSLPESDASNEGQVLVVKDGVPTWSTNNITTELALTDDGVLYLASIEVTVAEEATF